MNDIAGLTALVTGASRGFGRRIATALSQAGAAVVGVARDQTRLAQLRTELGDTFTPVVADAADPVVAGALFSSSASASRRLRVVFSRSRSLRRLAS